MENAMNPINRFVNARATAAGGRRLLRRGLLAALSALMTSWTSAAPVNWTFQDFRLDKPLTGFSATLTGGFTLDVDTQAVTDIHIVFDEFLNGVPVPNGKSVTLDSLIFYAPGDATDPSTYIKFRGLLTPTTSVILDLAFESSTLSNAGGTAVPWSVSAFGGPGNVTYTVYSGALIGVPLVSAVPEPAAWALVALGLAGAALARRRDSRGLAQRARAADLVES
jgi:hypothetical protein